VMPDGVAGLFRRLTAAATRRLRVAPGATAAPQLDEGGATGVDS
jgi:hypothetical protein